MAIQYIKAIIRRQEIDNAVVEHIGRKMTNDYNDAVTGDYVSRNPKIWFKIYTSNPDRQALAKILVHWLLPLLKKYRPDAYTQLSIEDDQWLDLLHEITQAIAAPTGIHYRFEIVEFHRRSETDLFQADNINPDEGYDVQVIMDTDALNPKPN